jgi:hypothetical protein
MIAIAPHLAALFGVGSGDAKRLSAPPPPRRRLAFTTWTTLSVVLAAAGSAQVSPGSSRPEAGLAFRHPDLFIPGIARAPAGLPPAAASAAVRRLEVLGISPDRALLDLRGNRWETLLPERPLVPGSGRGNLLRAGAHQEGAADGAAAAWEALVGYLSTFQTELQVDVAELGSPRFSETAGGDVVQIFAPRIFNRIPVRGSGLTAVVNRGNLILLATRNWGDISLTGHLQVDSAAARAALERRLAPVQIRGFERKPELAIVPMAAPRGGSRPAEIGNGYRHRLVWILRPNIISNPGSWEALVDAHSGDVLALQDGNRYASVRTVLGGVLPATDEDPEQAGYPMPHADVLHSERRSFTDSGGNLPLCVEGEIETALEGRFARVVDVCGPVSETSAGDLDLGTSSGADCGVAAGASAGNTRASRTVFYLLNRMREQGLGQLPENEWLKRRLTGITNFPPTLLGCNAFWDGSTVTLFAGDPAYPPAGCSNTGELATVVAHEWVHGLDDNDVDGTVSNPGEGIADILTALRFNDSCIGRGFFNGEQCDPGDGDPCLACDGVRDIDWQKRSTQQPHDPAFIDSSCPPGDFSAPGPCGGAIHCEGALESESAWDLLTRDLPAISSLDHQTALEVATRLFYLGSGLVGSWFQCTPADPVLGTSTEADGCNGDGGYLNLLAVDDDNGSLVDGTPHMEAIHSAFDRHGIACDLPAVANSGCSSGPTGTPNVSATPIDRGMRLTWDLVPGATRYAIFRGEGILGCSGGKARVGQTTGLEFVDEQLLNGFDYHYVVVPIGGSESCLGPASTCLTVSPEPGANLAADPVSTTLTFLNGDGDTAVDNCETVQLAADFHNIGLGALTNVRITGVQVLSHPTTVTVLESFPVPVAASLGACGTAQGSFSFIASGLSFNDALVFRLRFTADELGGVERSVDLRIEAVESDTSAEQSVTFGFENGLDGWEVVQGTFDRATGEGGDGSHHHLASSSELPGQCDQARSPLLRLSPSSTLSLWTSFDIEPPFTELPPYVFWFDRANVALHVEATGQRVPISPDGGRLYNAGGTDGSCVTQDQDGWADSLPAWETSSWSATQLGELLRPGQLVRLDVGYGTDDCGSGCDAREGFGFRFDEVTVTDVELVSADTQSDVCEPLNQAPEAVDDLVLPSTIEPVTVTVLANDSDPDAGDELRIASVDQPTSGHAEIDIVGPDLDTVTYTPEGCSAGLESFDYTVTDGSAKSVATVTVDLRPLADHAGVDLTLSSREVAQREVFVACHSLFAGDGGSPTPDDDFRVVASGEAILRAGESVALGNGSRIGDGASLVVILDSGLATSTLAVRPDAAADPGNSGPQALLPEEHKRTLSE